MRPLIVCALLLAPFAAIGQTVAGRTGAGNLPPDFYPQPKCEKPDKNAIGKSPGIGHEEAKQAYNFKVRDFNRRAETFNACMKDYNDRAQHDIDVIQATVHAAVAAANAP